MKGKVYIGKTLEVENTCLKVHLGSCVTALTTKNAFIQDSTTLEDMSFKY